MTPADKILNPTKYRINQFLSNEYKKHDHDAILEDLQTKQANKFTKREVDNLIEYFKVAPKENLESYIGFVFREYMSGNKAKDSQLTIFKFLLENREILVEMKKNWKKIK